MPASHTTNITPELERALGDAGEKEYRRLCRAIRMARGSFYLFPIESDFPNPLRDELLERLRADLAEEGCALRVAALNRQQWDLFALPELGEPVAPTEVVVLVGLEETPGIASRPGAEPVRPLALALLNRQREILHQRVPAPFLVWCLPFVYEALIEHAPDFFDHYTGLFRFFNSAPQDTRNRLIETPNGVARITIAVGSPVAICAQIDETMSEVGPIPSTLERGNGSYASLAFYEQQVAKHTDPTTERARALIGLAIALREHHSPSFAAQLERARTAAEEALTLLTPERDAYEWGRAQNVLGEILSELPTGNRVENLYDAITCFKAALHVYAQGQFPQQRATTQKNLGNLYRAQCQFQQAIECYKQSLVTFREIKDRTREGIVLNSLGLAYEAMAHWQQAIEFYEQSLVISQELKDRTGEGKVLNNLGIVYEAQGHWQQAIDCYEQSLAVFREFRDRLGEGHTLNNLGAVYYRQGRWQQAIKCHEQSLVIYREFNDRVSEGKALNNLGAVYQTQGRWQQAIEFYEQSLVIYREFNDRIGEGAILNNLGIVYAAQGHWQQAIDCYEQSLVICREINDRFGEGYTLNNLGIAYEAQGQFQRATEFYEQSLIIRREYKDRLGEGQCLENVALLFARQGDTSKALEWERQALRVLETTEDRRAIKQARSLIAAWKRLQTRQA